MSFTYITIRTKRSPGKKLLGDGETDGLPDDDGLADEDGEYEAETELLGEKDALGL